MDSAKKAEIRARLARIESGNPLTMDGYIWHGPNDVADLLAEVERLTAQITAVTRLHRPSSVYGECGHGHTEEGGNVKDIDDIGLTCAHEYDVCESCCTADGQMMVEVCLDHDHGPGKPICATIAALEAKS